jgi:hypothetical protein
VPNKSANTENLQFLLITISQETDSIWLAPSPKNCGSELILETTKRAVVTALSNCRHTDACSLWVSRIGHLWTAEPHRQCAVGAFLDIVFCKTGTPQEAKVHEGKGIPAAVAYRNLSVTRAFL